MKALSGHASHPTLSKGMSTLLARAQPEHANLVSEQCSQGSRNVPNVPDVPNVPNVPNDVPNIPGHVGSWLHILLLRWMSPFEPKIKTDIPKFQHVDFGCFWLILTDFGLILVNFGKMFRTI